ncbi:MAG TPA: hypothetical protein DEB24_05260 [Coriobacteriia bacterium]|nr:hypothetical protein [Coriobacteriia bacterium]
MICAAIYKTHDATHDQRFEVREIIRILAPTAAVGLLLLPYISIELRIACLGFMMLIAMLDEIVCWSAVSEYMHVYRLRPFANMAFGRLGDTIGCSLGYVCAYLVFGTTLGGNILSPIVLSIVVILFIILQIFFFRDNYSPFTEHSEAERDDEANLFPARKPGYWKERCERFADHHELTPRQRETLIHLAKGYSTKAIEGILFVSGHTVKAHVYNIYRKTGVHTRQELIEAIENFEHSGTGKSRNGIIQFG